MRLDSGTGDAEGGRKAVQHCVLPCGGALVANTRHHLHAAITCRLGSWSSAPITGVHNACIILEEDGSSLARQQGHTQCDQERSLARQRQAWSLHLLIV